MTIPTRSNGENILASWFNDIKDAIENNIANTTIITTDYTIVSGDKLITVDTSTVDITITLPPLSGNDGKSYIIKKTDSNAFDVIIDGDGSDTIDGELTQVLPNQYDVATVMAGAGEWHMLAASSSVFEEAITQKEIATPSTPDTGYMKLYPKTDGKYYKLDDTGTEEEIGKAILGKFETPTGLVNGVNVDYTISALPIDDTLICHRDGSIVPTDQFSFAHPVVTLVTPLELGQKIQVSYLTNGTSATLQLNASNQIVENRLITSGEVTAKQLTLLNTPAVPTNTIVDARGGSAQVYGLDFVISGTTFDWNGYALDGQISAGQYLRVVYYI